MKTLIIATIALSVASNAFLVSGAGSKGARAGLKPVGSRVRLQALAQAGSDDNFDGKITAGTFNLAKNVLGAGVLSLGSGVAFFSDVKTALVPACGLTVLMGAISTHAFKLIGEVCAKTNADTLEEAWTKLVGSGSQMVGLSITMLTFMAALAYSIILSDSFTTLGTTFNAPQFLQTRNNMLLTLTLGLLLPLCSLKSLTALAPFSILGLVGVAYTGVMMAIRLFDGSYGPGGKFFAAIAESGVPSFSKKGTSIGKTLVLTSMLSTNFICHYNAPRFLNEIKVPSVAQTIRRYNKIATNGFVASILFSMAMMSLGFLTFGSNTMGYILNNYAANDGLATIARFAIACALLTSYPLAFLGLRDGVFDFFKVSKQNRDRLHLPATMGILGAITTLAWFLKDVGFVVSISGAFFGSLLLFGFPCALKNAFIKKQATKEGRSISPAEKREIRTNNGIIGMGSALGVLGVVISCMKQAGTL